MSSQPLASASGPAMALIRPLYFFDQPKQGLHGDHPLFRRELHHLGIFPAQSHGACGIGPEGGKAEILQEKFCDAFEIMDVLAVDRHPHRRRDTVAPKGHEALQGLRETSLPPHGVVGLGHGAVDGYLDVVAALRRCKEGRHVIVDQCPVAEERNRIRFCTIAVDNLLEILAHERLATGQRHLHDGAAVQFLEEPDPLGRGEISLYIARALEMVAVPAPQVAAVRDGDVHFFRCSNQPHGRPPDGRLG